MELHQSQHLHQRLGQRLYTLVRRKDVEALEWYLAALALTRAFLLYRAPSEFAIFAFYAPLVNRAQFVLWLITGILLFVGPILQWRAFRAAVLVGVICLWFFSGWIMATNSQSPQISIGSFINAVFAMWPLFRLASRPPFP